MESRFKTSSGKIALFVVMTAVTVIANLIMVPMPQPLAEYDLAPVMIYTLGILLDPVLAILCIAVAMGIGVSYKMVLFGFPPVFVIGAMLVRGLEAGIISYIVRLRKSSNTKTITTLEVLVMGLGAVWETLGFYSIDWYLFGQGAASIDLFTIVDLIFIPIAVGVIIGVRRSLKTSTLT